MNMTARPGRHRRESRQGFSGVVLMRFRHAILPACVVSVALLGGYFAFFRGRAAETRYNAEVSANREACLEALAAARMTPMSALMTDAIARPAIMHVDADVTPAMEGKLVREVQEFLLARYAKSPDDYLSWRRSRGFTLRDRSELEKWWHISEVVADYRGREVSKEESTEALFLEAISLSNQRKSGRQRIVGTSLTHEWSIIIEKRSALRLPRNTPPWDQRDPRFVTRQSFVTAPATGGSESWWQRGASYIERTRSEKGVLVATASFFAEFGDGERLPVATYFYFDQERDSWTITGISVATQRVEDGRRFEF